MRGARSLQRAIGALTGAGARAPLAHKEDASGKESELVVPHMGPRVQHGVIPINCHARFV